ncbi:MAG: Gfo/Idh/MocA family oxidoreductase [Pseudomonadota bacterium]|nr:Gfo/Idh/MocA family oxidoreductase [Pseudomonadota bacterium]
MHSIHKRKIKIALVGCGRIFHKHLEALHRHKANLELVGVCDTDALALTKAVEKTGVKGFNSLEQMLSNCDADIIGLCTPSGLHPQQTIDCAQAGRHVMTEKPMATRWIEGKRMVQACDHADVYLFVIKQNRCNPTLQLVRQAITKKRFGRIYMVNLNVFWHRPQHYYEQAPWRGTWEFDGGALMNQASHYIDLLDWLIGPIERVHAYTATLARHIEVEDTAVANIKWRSGSLGSVNVTMLTYPQNLEGSMTILGETGSVKIGGIAVNEIQHWQFATPAEEDAQVEQANYATTSVYGFGHRLYYENVIQVLRGQAMPETDGREGLRSLETLIALYLSARDGRQVSLPLDY